MMASERNTVISIFVQAVIAGIVSGLLIAFGLSGFFGGNPGKSSIEYLAPYIATGIASAYFSIAMTVYPVIKKGEKNFELEDFK